MQILMNFFFMILAFLGINMQQFTHVSKSDCVKVGSYCVIDLKMNYNAINTCNSSEFDSNLKNNKYCAENYWAGAKKACQDIDMELANIDTYKKLYENGYNNNSCRYYWSSDEQNADFGRSFSLYDGKEYKGGYYKNFKDKVLCVDRNS